jgi:hypothetical protein
MKNILATLVLFLTLAFAGCDDEGIDLGGPNMGYAPVARKEYPAVNPPLGLRQPNWLGRQGEGSCVHANMVTLFHWQGHHQMARHWRATYGDGEIADETFGPGDNLRAKLTREGVRFAQTTKGDVEFLEWACSTRRGCGVTVMGGKHMVTLVHFDDEWAGILDNNDINKIIWVERQTFVSEWQNSNGWAVTPIYTPLPPLPH